MGKGGKSNGDVAEVKNAAEEENMAAWLVSINSLKILPFKLPALGPHDVKVTMKAVGICGSDVHLLKTLKLCDYVAKEPVVIGHECAGIVAEVGSEVKSLVPGDRVALEPGISCWRCQQCKEGSYNLCPDMKCFATPPVHGSLANQVVHPADLCFKLPDNLTLEEGAMCEPLSVAVHACRRANIGSETNVLVMGAGPIGLVAMLAARAFGAPRIVIVDVDDYRLSVAKKLGADEIVNVSTNTQQNMMQVVTQPPHANPHRPNVEFPVHLPPPPPPPLAEAVHPPPPPPPPPAAAGHASVLAVRHQNIANPIEPVVTEVVVGADGQVISRFYNLLTHQRYQYRLDLVLAERRNQWRGLRGRVGPFMSEWHFNRRDGVLKPSMEGARLTSGILRGYSVFREKHTHHGNLRDLSCFYFNILTTQGYEDEYEVFIVPSSGPRVTNVAAFGVVADRIALCSILFGEVLESIDASISGLNPAQDPPRTYQPEMRDLYDLLGGINVANGSALAMELSNHCGLWSETKKKTYCLTYELLRRCHQSVVEASVELFKVHESYADPTVPNWHYLAEIDQGVLNKVLMYPPGLCTTWYADPWGTLYQATNHRYVHSAVSFLSFVCNVFKHDPLGSHDAETEFILSKNYPLYIVKLVKALNDTGLKSH